MNIYGYDAPHLPLALLGWVATTEIRLWMYGSDTIHGVLRLLHLLGVGGFLGTVFVINLKQLGFYPQATLLPMRQPLLNVLEVSFWVAIVSGAALFVYDPIGVGLHTMFLPKLVLIVLGYVLAKWPQKGPRRPIRRGFASSSLVIWFLVVACSTWNHIEHPKNPADVHRHDAEDTNMRRRR